MTEREKTLSDLDYCVDYLMKQMRDHDEEAGDSVRVAGWNWLIEHERRLGVRRDRHGEGFRLWYSFGAYESIHISHTYPTELPRRVITLMGYFGNHSQGKLLDRAAWAVGTWLQELEEAKR